MDNESGTPAASAEMDRRKLLKVGAVGAAATGAVVAGGPSVLGLGKAPMYAGAATVTTTVTPTTGNLTVTLNMWDGQQYPPRDAKDDRQSLPLAIPTNTYQASLYSDAAGTNLVQQVYIAGNAGDNFISFTFSGLSAGTYYVDIDEPFSTVGNTLLDQYVTANNIPGGPYDMNWNVAYAYSQPTPPPPASPTTGTPHGASNNTAWPRYEAAAVTAGTTATLTLDIQVRIVPGT